MLMNDRFSGTARPQKNSCQKQKKNDGLEIAVVNTDQGCEVEKHLIKKWKIQQSLS